MEGIAETRTRGGRDGSRRQGSATNRGGQSTRGGRNRGLDNGGPGKRTESDSSGEMETDHSGEVDSDEELADWDRTKEHMLHDDSTNPTVPFRKIVTLFCKMELPYQKKFGKLGMKRPTAEDKAFIEGLKFKTEQFLNELCTGWDREHPTAKNCDELVRHFSEAMHMVDVEAERWARVHAWMKNRMEEVAFNHSLGKAELAATKDKLEKSEEKNRILEDNVLEWQQQCQKKMSQGQYKSISDEVVKVTKELKGEQDHSTALESAATKKMEVLETKISNQKL